MKRFLAGLFVALSLPVLAEQPVLKASKSQTLIPDSEVITAPVTIAAELLGSGVLYSLQSSYRYADFGAVNLGFAVLPVTSGSGTAVLIPVSNSFLIGRGSHNLDISVGMLVGAADTDAGSGAGVVPHTSIGYRYSPRQGGLAVRVNVNQFIGASNAALYFWPGLAIGGTF